MKLIASSRKSVRAVMPTGINVVQQPLLIIGMDRKLLYERKVGPRKGRHFWVRHDGNLESMLSIAQSCYRSAIKAAHPDKPGGSHKKATMINSAWKRIKYLFGKRGVSLNS